MEAKLSSGGNDNKCELDVVILKGYQLYAITCTVKLKRKELKQKLFEVQQRAKQLGGDEANIGAVCLYLDSDDLEKELARDIGGNVKVFGRDALPFLDDELFNWING